MSTRDMKRAQYTTAKPISKKVVVINLQFTISFTFFNYTCKTIFERNGKHKQEATCITIFLLCFNLQIFNLRSGFVITINYFFFHPCRRVN